MNKIFRTLMFFNLFFLTSYGFADEPIKKVSLPIEVKKEILATEVPKEVEGKQWNRWTSDNFVVCSLNDTQAQYLHKHLELVKVWVLSRWGLYDVDFSSNCKLICVDDPILFEKLFKIKRSRVEIRRDDNGQIKETVIFLLINDAPSHTVPVPLTEVCLAEFAQKYNTKVDFWAYRGISMLNGSIDQIKAEINQLEPIVKNNGLLYFSQRMMEMTREQYLAESIERQELYDQCAMVMCLMIRKEMGQDKFHWLIKTTHGDPQKAVKEVLGFDTFDYFDRTLKRYLIDLTRDVSEGKTPDRYMQIREKGKD